MSEEEEKEEKTRTLRRQNLSTDTSTHIDLGDDLLESTVTSGGEVSESQTRPVEDLADLLQSAKILAGEGLNHEAKRLLRKILLQDPTHLPARRVLEKIQELELKELLHEDAPVRRNLAPLPASISSETVDQVISKLDKDFGLGLNTVSLFQDPAIYREFTKTVEIALLNASAQDRIDLGIAFLEMGLPELGAVQFKAALQIESYFLSASALRSFALILAGQPLQAVLEIQAIIKDGELKREDLLEFFYLLGRAYDALGEKSKAKTSYVHAQKIDPYYRDLEERLRIAN